MSRGPILRSLTPLYLARVASFVIETETLVAGEVEERIERLCLTFEELKPYLIARWNGQDVSRAELSEIAVGTAPPSAAKLEVHHD